MGISGGKIRFFAIFPFLSIFDPGLLKILKKVEKMKNSIKIDFLPRIQFLAENVGGGWRRGAEKFFRPPEEKNVDRKIVGKKIPG
jgi:hypothetical protein